VTPCFFALQPAFSAQKTWLTVYLACSMLTCFAHTTFYYRCQVEDLLRAHETRVEGFDLMAFEDIKNSYRVKLPSIFYG